MARSTIITYLVFALVVFGLVMVGDASVVDAAKDFGDKWYYLKLQAAWAAVGIVGFFLASRWPYQKLIRLAPFALGTTIFLLIAVLIPGISSKLLGARRWLSFGSFSFQPAELAKLSSLLYFASLLKNPNKFVPFIIILGLLSTLIMLEPDLGTTLVLVGSSLITYFGSGSKLTPLLLTTPVLIILVLSLVLFSPYRLDRLKTFFDYSRDPLGSSYHIRQVLLSLGSGNIFGVGLGQSRQKYEFLPEVTTDSIFAIIAEEFGLIGSIATIALFSIFFYQGLKVVQASTEPFAVNLSLGITTWITLQALINISAMVALLPLTGIPLPFISYGGSSLVIVLLASGILVNIARQNEK